MADYRIYCVDGAGRIALADWLEADTDEEAVCQAREMRPEASRCEIWQKARLVAKLNSAGGFERIAPSSL
jgi:hypothetical protein